MLNTWNDKAGRLHDKVRMDEYEAFEKGLNMYEDDFVKSQIVHTRQDVVLLASHLNSLNQQLWTLRFLVLIIVIMLAYKIFF